MKELAVLAYVVALIGGSWLYCRWLFMRYTRPSRLDRARSIWMLEDACSFERTEVSPGLFKGRSVFTGKDTYVRLHVDRPRFVVDYDVGGAPDTMQFRNMSRVIPGGLLKIALS